MRWSPRVWLLGCLDAGLTEEQLRLPPDELGRYRVVMGAAGLLVVLSLIALSTLVGHVAERPSLFGAALVNLLSSVLVLALVRRLPSPTVPAFLLCTALAVSFLLATLSVEVPGAVAHASTMLMPALTVFLLGPRWGFAFTALFIFNAAFFHEFYHSDFGRLRPFFVDREISLGNFMASVSLLVGWALTWLFCTTREESHWALQRALKTLRESESKLVSLIESTDDVVLALDKEGGLVTANRVAKELLPWMSGREFLPGQPFLELCVPEVRALFQERVDRALAGHRLKMETCVPIGGQLRTFEITFNPVWEGAQVVGVTIFSRDLTEHKEAEAKVGEMHRSLVEVSRQAGMAEIATGVLHNVRNALNSVNVSADVVVERVRGSRIQGLARVVELLRENAAQLGSFFEQDTRGRQLPAYLEALSSQLQQERETVLLEMRRLGESVEHIKSVVAMQQKHARVSGVMERVTVPTLIDDALRLHAVAFDRLGIHLRREYAEVPPVLVDRHKLLQILVNLVSNARQALLECGREDKQLTLRVEAGEKRLRIAVADNGAGIAPEHMSRLFTQGFTTKRDGHGFGLHISALTAGEMGGTLTCVSQGPGQGATFTLELPMMEELGIEAERVQAAG